MTKSWWDHAAPGMESFYSAEFGSRWAMFAVAHAALASGSTMFDWEQPAGTERQFVDGKTVEDLDERVRALGGVLIRHRCKSSHPLRVYVWSHGLFDFAVNTATDNVVGAHVITTDKSLFDELTGVVTTWTKVADTKGGVYILVHDQNNKIVPRWIGKGSEKLERGNYMPEVLRGYDHVVEDLCAPDPCGRVVIVDGVQGTGKTFLGRGLIHDASDAMFLLVQPDVVQELARPDQLSALVDVANTTKKRLVLFIEDGDFCIVRRQKDNLSIVTALLNMSEGILGRALDISIVVTTNVKVSEIDPAVMRPMRMCRRLQVGQLSGEQAGSVYARLTGVQRAAFPACTLAEVYQQALAYRNEVAQLRVVGGS